MAASLDVTTLVSRALALSSTKTGLEELQVSLDASCDLLRTNASEALDALEQNALHPKTHALAWLYFLNAAKEAATPRSEAGAETTGARADQNNQNTGGDENNEGGEDEDADTQPATAGDDTGNDVMTTDTPEPEPEAHHAGIGGGIGATIPTALPTIPKTSYSVDFGTDARDRDFARGGSRGFLGDHFGIGDVGHDMDDDPAGYDDGHDVLALPEPVAVKVCVTDAFPAFLKLTKALLMESDHGVAADANGDASQSEAVNNGDAINGDTVHETSMDVGGDVETSNETAASAQLRRAPKLFHGLCAQFKAETYANGIFTDLVAAVEPLRKALRAARPTKHHLTKQHALLFQTCLNAKRPDVALTELDENPIFTCDPTETGIDALDYLNYCDVSGSVYVTVGKFEDAAESFLNATTAPANGPVAAHASLHKKYILCSLIAQGSVPFLTTLPKYASSSVTRHLRSATHKYVQFAEAFATKSSAKLNAKLDELSETFKTDGDLFYDLAVQAAAGVTKVNVLGLTKTHLSVSLADIALAAGLPNQNSAEQLVVEMIDASQIRAKICQKTDSVVFVDLVDDPFFAETEAGKLRKSMATARELAERIRKKDDEIRVSKKYVAATSDFHGHGGLAGTGKGDAIGLSGDAGGAKNADHAGLGAMFSNDVLDSV